MADKNPDKIVYRPATAMDSVNIVRLLKSQYDESAARHLAPFNEKQILQYVTITLGNFDPEQFSAAWCVVAEKGGRILGSLALANIAIPWNREFVVMAECWFVVVTQYHTKGVVQRLKAYADDMLDRGQRAAFFGTNMYTTGALDKIIGDAPDMHPARSTYIRVPGKPKTNA